MERTKPTYLPKSMAPVSKRPATKKPSIPFKAKAVGFLLTVLFAHFLSVKLFAYPFLYCWFAGLVFPIWDAVSSILCVGLFLYIVYSVFRLSRTGFFTSVFLFAVNLSVPTYATIIFHTGGSCT